ncbi:acetylcholinesterase precursor [Massarina eburnea CBS 473.64]|uniref:Carboxylic ester hydrolase n=1 Tax=Massarina eburnea CBS 473.64 TaxID=1395130 RepID=A0A6A6S1R3_9PLEO|nr:acetylcholinesterase precursor [Massarina eburnea CBS 473.64]
MALLSLLFRFAILTHAITANPLARPFEKVKRQANTSSDPIQVDLGYEIYRGIANSSTGLNTFKGIRFADPPIGDLRWQAPVPPTSNRSNVISADSFAPTCPQTPRGSAGLASLTSGTSEDCLFLNVYAPQNASDLPVLFWIHGGGYGQGNGRQEMTNIINANSKGFVGVSIQYRLGAFGFLSSDEVFRNGVVNAGLLDQYFALQWVQSYIHLFGGDPTRVTIAGLSAGAGSVMLQDIAYGGSLGTSLFTNSISASPYLPQQYGYKDWIPSQNYYAFATAAGCPPQWAYGNSSQTIFQCLTSRSTSTLQNASATVSNSGTWGAWGFLPVTDGVFIQTTPSEALLNRKVNGLNHLSGNNAEEGRLFTTPNITTENDLVAWIQLVFPLFTTDDIAKLLYYYSTSNISVSAADIPEFASAGDMGLTALNTSQTATGQQERANTIYAETTFICPSYWLAEAYNSHGRTGYKYQYSVVNAVHGSDLTAYFGTPTPNQGPDFVFAFERIWGNFVINSNPSISSAIANGARANGSAMTSGLENWPVFAMWDRRMANLNQTGGTPTITPVGGAVTGETVNVITYQGEGVKNALELVDAYAWEGGRGVRCDFWKSVAGIVPE